MSFADSCPLRCTVCELTILQASTLRRDVFPAPELPNMAVTWPPGHRPETLFKIVLYAKWFKISFYILHRCLMEHYR